MANPLKAKPDDDNDGWLGKEPGMTLEDLWQWCADANQRRFVIAASWWYFVRKGEDGRHFVDKLEGWRAQEARARVAGKPIEWFKPTPEDSAAIRAFVDRCAEQEMTMAEFRQFVARTGGANRAAGQGELV